MELTDGSRKGSDYVEDDRKAAAVRRGSRTEQNQFFRAGPERETLCTPSVPKRQNAAGSAL